MCIRSLEADIDRDILKINGREVKLYTKNKRKKRQSQWQETQKAG